MRDADHQTAAMFSYIRPEGLVPQNHSLRPIRPLVNAALLRQSGRFEPIYAPHGRNSVAPKKLLRALMLEPLSPMRSERQPMDAPVWDVTVFTKNRVLLPASDIARGFVAAILLDPNVKPLLSDEHFSVERTNSQSEPQHQGGLQYRLLTWALWLLVVF